MSGLNIKNFSTLSTTTGKIQISGQTNDLTQITSQNEIINNISDGVTIPGTPSSITGGPLLNIGYMGNTPIRIIKDNIINTNESIVYIPDGIIRITFLGGSTSNALSLLYGFTNSIFDVDIEYNVVIANSNSQTVGDYFDIFIPDISAYPTLYIVFYVLNGAWDTRTIVSGNICSIDTYNSLNYCIDPSQSLSDPGNSHFIFVNGVNTHYGITPRISVSVDDELMATSNKDYNNLKFSVSSRFLNESEINDNYTTISICFRKGTKILCLVDDTEMEINVEDLKIGMFVKTYKNGYKKILKILKSDFINSKQKIHNRMYKMKNADLHVTGGHSILVNELSEKEKEESIKIFGKLEKIQDKYRLLSCISDNFIPLNDNNRHHTYHISVGEQDIIYADNVLSETFCLSWYNNKYKKCH